MMHSEEGRLLAGRSDAWKVHGGVALLILVKNDLWYFRQRGGTIIVFRTLGKVSQRPGFGKGGSGA